MRLENLSSVEVEAIIQKKRRFVGRIAVFVCCPLLTSQADAVRIFGLYCVMNILMNIRSLRRSFLLGEEELQTTPFSDIPPRLKTVKLILLFHGYEAENDLSFDTPVQSIFGAEYCFLGAAIGFLGSVIDTSLTDQMPNYTESWFIGGVAIFLMLAKFVLQKEFVEKGLKNLSVEDQRLARICLQKEASLRVCSATFLVLLSQLLLEILILWIFLQEYRLDFFSYLNSIKRPQLMSSNGSVFKNDFFAVSCSLSFNA